MIQTIEIRDRQANATQGDWRDVLRTAAKDAVPCDRMSITRIEVDLPSTCPFAVHALDLAPEFPRMFWKSRSALDRVAAAGEVATGPLDELLSRVSRGDGRARIFGGAGFDETPSLLADWQDFPTSRFFVPKMEWMEIGAHNRLAVHLTAESPGCEVAIAWVEQSGGPGTPVAPAALARWDTPHFDAWQRSVQLALGRMAAGDLDKVVLARKSWFELAEPVPAFALAGLLAAGSPSCFHFCFEPDETSGAFLGASPELLYRRRGRRIDSEAVAGTRPRSMDTAEDERMESQLMGLEKERREHAVVVDALRCALGKVCEHVEDSGSPELLKLARIQHLRTSFMGRLRENLEDPDVLAALHPTPATCGRPRKAALEFLRSVEPFDRGWYAGPVGVAGRNFAEFAVAIRSMRLRGSVLDVFAGAGIVPGSVPESEWAELESKIGDALRLLSL